MAKRAIVNYFIDIGLVITFLLSVITGIFKWPALVPLFGWEVNTYKTFSTIHDWSGLIMALLVLTHIILHWRWIVIMTKSMCNKKKKKGGVRK